MKFSPENKYMHLPSLTYFLRSFLLWKLTSSNSCSKALGDRVLTESTMELNLSQLTAIMTDCKRMSDLLKIYNWSIDNCLKCFQIDLMDTQERTCITEELSNNLRDKMRLWHLRKQTGSIFSVYFDTVDIWRQRRTFYFSGKFLITHT